MENKTSSYIPRDFYRDKSSCVLRFVRSKSYPQLVKIIYSKTPLNPKKGKGKPEKGSGAVTKKGRASVGEIEVS